jgi:periplasmic protein TonB
VRRMEFFTALQDGPRLRHSAALVALVAHGGVLAALSNGTVPPSAFSAPSVLAVQWIGEEQPQQREAVPDKPAKPRTEKPRVRSEPVAEPVLEEPVAEKPAAVEALPEPPPSTLAASAPVPADEPALVVPPRFNADYLSNPAPIYPVASRSVGEQGRVLLRVLVSPEGEPREVLVGTGSGYERLDLAALDAVRRWKFVPARRGLEAVTAWVIVPIQFTLRR